jgi:tellurite resistance protein
MRETAFAVATDLALADGEIASREKDVLTKIQQSLGIPEDKAVNIIEVMLIKNKG